MLLVDARSQRVSRANRALGDLLGWPADELTGRTLLDLDPARPEEVEEYLLLALACRDDRARRRIWRTRDGEDLPVEIHAARLHGDQGTLLALYIRDARSDDRAEKDLGHMESRLYMAQKHEAVGRLASGIAHDFSNILASVMLTAESLRERLSHDTQGLAQLDTISDAGMRARELIREILAFSGKQEMAAHPMGLKDVVMGMESALRRTLPQDIDLVLRMGEGEAVVNVDPVQMQQVLLTLVAHARDAMPEGGYLVVSVQEVELEEASVAHRPALQAGPHVLLSVSDTGEGMDEETQARIFEPFFSTRERSGGPGLGLATVYGIVKQSGGTIWVTSQPGVGSTFRLYLPRVLPRGTDAISSKPVDVASSRSASKEIPRGSEHVLLVDDDDELRERTAEALRELGYRVTEATDGEEALALHEGMAPEEGIHPVDLVLTDVVMPRMSGVDLAQHLRERRPDLPILYMSSYLATGDDDGTATEHLAKPFTLAELSQRVRAYVERRSS